MKSFMRMFGCTFAAAMTIGFVGIGTDAEAAAGKNAALEKMTVYKDVVKDVVQDTAIAPTAGHHLFTVTPATDRVNGIQSVSIHRALNQHYKDLLGAHWRAKSDGVTALKEAPETAHARIAAQVTDTHNLHDKDGALPAPDRVKTVVLAMLDKGADLNGHGHHFWLQKFQLQS